MYESTRGNLRDQSASEAITLGMVPAGGLFVPQSFPKLDWEPLKDLNYSDLSKAVMKPYLLEFPERVFETIAQIYTEGTFDTMNPAPLVSIGDFGVLELWHGPTAAFKDMALQVLPVLLKGSLENLGLDSEVLILVATSGDTGKAALEGFKNVPGTQIMVFYPDGGVSPVQERQMTTTDGSNTHVVAVKGNFDQCQTAVKDVFGSEHLRKSLHRHNKVFSSANSINWGRLLPQVVYYFWAYLEAARQGKIKPGEPINVVVPTGNFGNILAAYYAKRMGLPLAKLICASNDNNVLTDFFHTGIYDIHRPFYQTISPSMDILISSNFERFLYEMCGRNPDQIRAWFTALKEKGRFQVEPEILKRCQAEIFAGWANEQEVMAVISQAYQEYDYVFDPHTAVGVKVYQQYRTQTGDGRFTVIASTASPYKFASTVYEAITKSRLTDEWEALSRLYELTGWEIPFGLRGLRKRQPRNVRQCEPGEIPQLIRESFGLN